MCPEKNGAQIDVNRSAIVFLGEAEVKVETRAQSKNLPILVAQQKSQARLFWDQISLMNKKLIKAKQINGTKLAKH